VKCGKRGFGVSIHRDCLAPIRLRRVSRFRESCFLCRELSAWRDGGPLAVSFGTRVTIILKEEAKQCRWLMETRERSTPRNTASDPDSHSRSRPPCFLRWFLLPPLPLIDLYSSLMEWWPSSMKRSTTNSWMNRFEEKNNSISLFYILSFLRSILIDKKIVCNRTQILNPRLMLNMIFRLISTVKLFTNILIKNRHFQRMIFNCLKWF